MLGLVPVPMLMRPERIARFRRIPRGRAIPHEWGATRTAPLALERVLPVSVYVYTLPNDETRRSFPS